MDRRRFVKRSALGAGLLSAAKPTVSLGQEESNRFDQPTDCYGNPPVITDRLDHGPFTTYGPEATAIDNYITMVTQPVQGYVPNRGMGMVTYLCDEAGPPKVSGNGDQETLLYRTLEDLVRFPLGDQLYLRLDWRDIQSERGKLNFPIHWKMAFDLARQYEKPISFRVQLMSPVIQDHSMPDFLLDEVPVVRLGTTDEIGIPGKVHYAPRYDHPAFMSAFKELDDLLAEQFNDDALIEYVDTSMYGFWGEGHTWPFEGNPFPDYATAENTSLALLEYQISNWTKTPLATNTQPDYSQVGNASVLEQTIAANHWLRTDTIFIEPEQIEALSKRPPWVGATIENGFSNGKEESLRMMDGEPRTEYLISHIHDVGPTHGSLWNWHDLSASNLKRYFDTYPDGIHRLRNSIGYKLRPSWVWTGSRPDENYIILGLVNDGIAGVPGALVLSLRSEQGETVAQGMVDPGYPIPGKVCQVAMTFATDIRWKGLTLSAEIEIKGVRHPIHMAAKQCNKDGSLTLRQNV